MAHLVNPLASVSQVRDRFALSALPQDLHDIVFFATQCLTQAAGQLLRLPQSVTAQANVILARYWLVESPTAFEFSDASAAALFLVAKLGPEQKSPRDVANVYAYLLSPDSSFFRSEPIATGDPAVYCQSEADYADFANRLIAVEAPVAFSMSLNMHVSLPHALAITYLQTLEFLGKAKLDICLRTVQYLNTALLSPQMPYLTHQPLALAVAAIYAAARDLGAKMPDCAWWEVFDVDREELGFLVVAMRSLEGCVRAWKEHLPQLFEGVLTRRAVEREMRKRGLPFQVGSVDD